MNLIKKRVIIYIAVIIAGIFLITAGFIKNRKSAETVPAVLSEPVKAVQKANTSTVAVKTPQKVKFESNDEIKEEYGKLETVTLWNGKTYTGAVINTDEVYSIVTVDGLIKIPMKEVKIRDIIR